MNIDALKVRAGILRQIHAFFDARGFVEVETPVRIAAPAPEPHIDCPMVAPAAKPTFLRASPELQMKKLLAAGMDRIYQIGPCFREGECGRRHNPEFTMLEWYRANADYLDILADMEELVSEILADRIKKAECPDRKFTRLTVRDAYLKWAQWDPFTDWDADRFDVDMATKIEPNIPKEPVFLMDYPPQAASLSRLRGDVAERWELYVDGMELANAFSELVDPDEQRRRFDLAREERRQLGEADYPIDEEFLESLSCMPPSAGVALGVDRLVMLVCSAETISAVRTIE